MVNLTELKKLNTELELITTHPTLGNVEYMVDGGKCIGFNLYHADDISIQRAHMEKGTHFPRHAHKEKEWILQILGEAELTLYDNGNVTKIISMSPKSMVEIPKNVSHSYEAKTNVELLGIVMPASNEYPS